MKRRVMVSAAAVVLLALSSVQAAAVRPGFDSSFLEANDDYYTGFVSTGFDTNFFGTTYTGLYVNNNGNVTFNGGMGTFTPFGLTGPIGTPILAPFFADVDTRAGNVTRYGTGAVDGRNAFGVSWVDVGYYNSHTDKTNSFQLVMIDRSDRNAGDFDVEFNYDRILWETGDASGGSGGFGGSSARAGYSNGTGDPGTFYEFPGSGVHSYFLDNSGTGLIHHSINSPVLGRYLFSVVNGTPEPPIPGVPAPGAILLGSIGAGLVGWLRRRKAV